MKLSILLASTVLIFSTSVLALPGVPTNYIVCKVHVGSALNPVKEIKVENKFAKVQRTSKKDYIVFNEAEIAQTEYAKRSGQVSGKVILTTAKEDRIHLNLGFVFAKGPNIPKGEITHAEGCVAIKLLFEHYLPNGDGRPAYSLSTMGRGSVYLDAYMPEYKMMSWIECIKTPQIDNLDAMMFTSKQ